MIILSRPKPTMLTDFPKAFSARGHVANSKD